MGKETKFGQQPLIVVLSGVKGDTRRYRNHHLYEQLQLSGLPVLFSHITDNNLFRKIEKASVVILHRAPYDSHVAKIAAITREYSILFAYDLDDLIFDEQALNWINAPEFQEPVRRNVFKEDLELHKLTLDQCKVALASTDFLADVLTKMNKRTWVHRNAFSLEMLAHSQHAHAQVHRDPGKVIIGYASGSPTHNKDFGVARPALMRILQQYPQVELHLIGPLDPGAGWGDLGARIYHHKLVPWRKLPEILASFDINIAPLVSDNPFGQSKSEIKWMEAALVHVPTVASPTDAFKFAIQNGTNGFLAFSEEGWFDSLARLIEDRLEREAVGEQAYQDVFLRYHPAVRAVQLVNTLNQIHQELLGCPLVERSVSEQDTFFRVDKIPWLSPVMEQHPTLPEMALYNLRQHGASKLARQIWAYVRRRLVRLFPYKSAQNRRRISNK